MNPIIESMEAAIQMVVAATAAVDFVGEETKLPLWTRAAYTMTRLQEDLTVDCSAIRRLLESSGGSDGVADSSRKDLRVGKRNLRTSKTTPADRTEDSSEDSGGGN